jgi:hypothetical protein
MTKKEAKLWDALNHANYYISRFRLLMLDKGVPEYRSITPESIESTLNNNAELLATSKRLRPDTYKGKGTRTKIYDKET